MPSQFGISEGRRLLGKDTDRPKGSANRLAKWQLELEGGAPSPPRRWRSCAPQTQTRPTERSHATARNLVDVRFRWPAGKNHRSTWKCRSIATQCRAMSCPQGPAWVGPEIDKRSRQRRLRWIRAAKAVVLERCRHGETGKPAEKCDVFGDIQRLAPAESNRAWSLTACRTGEGNRASPREVMFMGLISFVRLEEARDATPRACGLATGSRPNALDDVRVRRGLRCRAQVPNSTLVRAHQGEKRFRDGLR